MSKKWNHLIMVGILALVICSCSGPSNDPSSIPTDLPTDSPTEPPAPPEQPEATATLADTQTPSPSPTPTLEPPPTKAPILDRVFEPADPVQMSLFGLVPADYLGAGYCNNKQIKADPEISAIFEASPDSCPFLDSQTLDIDGLMGVSIRLKGDNRVSMGIVYILSGDFTSLTLPELIQEMEMEDPVHQGYQDFDLMITEGEGAPNFAATILDDANIVFGEETGVKAVLDTAISLDPAPLADLGAALPQMVYASVLKHCPQYEDLGCTSVVMVGLVQEAGPDFSLIKFYQFEDPESATSALETILAAGEDGLRIQFGSVDIIGDVAVQEGRFILVESFITLNEIGKLFE